MTRMCWWFATLALAAALGTARAGDAPQSCPACCGQPCCGACPGDCCALGAALSAELVGKAKKDTSCCHGTSRACTAKSKCCGKTCSCTAPAKAAAAKCPCCGETCACAAKCGCGKKCASGANCCNAGSGVACVGCYTQRVPAKVKKKQTAGKAVRYIVVIPGLPPMTPLPDVGPLANIPYLADLFGAPLPPAYAPPPVPAALPFPPPPPVCYPYGPTPAPGMPSYAPVSPPPPSAPPAVTYIASGPAPGPVPVPAPPCCAVPAPAPASGEAVNVFHATSAPSVTRAIASPSAGSEKVYVVDLKLVSLHSGGKSQPLCCPRLSIPEGQAKVISIGKSVALKQGSVEDLVSQASYNCPEDEVHLGNKVVAKVTGLTKDQVRVDLAVNQCAIDTASQSDIVVAGSCLRAVQKVTLGKTVRLTVEKNDRGKPRTVVEFRVTSWSLE